MTAMPNDVRKESTGQPSPSISSDFLTGSTEIGLDRIRTRLLDLTNRNKLLNFRHSNASSLRVVDVPIDSVFTRLRDNDKLGFLPVPEPELTPGSDRPTAKEYASKLGWNTSFDLDDTDDKGGLLPVLHYQEQLDTVSRKITTAARTAIEESGTNMLYLVFGFLEWYESDDSKQPHLAPLVIVPVTIERSGGRGRSVETVLEYSGEDIETNLSLLEKMRRDFGLEIPLLEDDEAPEAYFKRFAEILNLKRGWSIRRHITLALLSFGKLLMYRDLDPKTWPAGQSIDKHPLVRELFEGSKSPSITLAEEFPIDAADIQKDVPQLIRDADSSQHSALIHALRGQNLVIEGPPGTGKSQTITNLIAAALAKGKSVLFVAEKLAALEVVRRRLDDAGLGVFCLEVHSHKTKKGALLSDLAQRAKLRGSFKDPRDLDRHLSIVDEKKQLLTEYASLINKTIQPFQATVFEILWARDYFGQEIAAHRDRLGQLVLPTILQFTRTHFTQTEQFLSVYAQHLTAVLTFNAVDQHPWAWVTKPLAFPHEEDLLSLLENLLSVIREADVCCDHLQNTVGVVLARTVRGLDHAASTLALLPSSEGTLNEDLLAPCHATSTRDLLLGFIEQVESFQRGVQSLSVFTDNATALLDATTLDELSGAYERIRRWGLEGCSFAEISEVLKQCEQTQHVLREAHSSYGILHGITGGESSAKLSSATLLLRTAALLRTAPFDQLHLRQPTFESEGVKPLLLTAEQEATALKDAEVALSKDVDLTVALGLHKPLELLEAAAVLDKASLWQRIWGDQYRRAVRVYRSITIGATKPQRHQMSRTLRSVADYIQSRASFENRDTYRQRLGMQFQGVNTQWDSLQQLLVWYEEVFVAFPEHRPEAEPLRRLMFDARTDRLKAIKASLTTAEEHQRVLAAAVSHIAEFARQVPPLCSLIGSGTFKESEESLERCTNELRDVIGILQRIAVRGDVTLRSIPNIVKAAGHCCAAMCANQGSSELSALLGSAYRGVHTDVVPVKHTVQIAEAVASGDLSPKTVHWLLCPDYRMHLEQLREWLQTVLKCGETIRAVTEELTATSGSPLWSSNADCPLSRLQVLAEVALANRDELTRWNHFIRLQTQSHERGLGRLTALADARSLEPHEIVSAFRFVFHNTLARSIFTEHTELSHATGITQELIRDQFAAADKEAIRLYSERVAALIDQRRVPPGNQSGPVRTWTEMALITNEINKQKRHIPIRQLIRRAANALVALKPCFMMGPLSVAQYLAPGQLKFDLIVMDEASQLKPEDAIGALARGGQVVIVGDPKQLPPTSFFQRVMLEADEDNNTDSSRTAVEEGESILDVASTLFQPVRRLRWHYRSRHHSLIAFSNHEFYQRDLIIFPSAYHDDSSLGVRHHFVPDGVFEGGRNPREAEVVVEAVMEHLRQHPTESLGVVTLNFEQRELVEELLDRRLRDDPFAVAYMERMKGAQETLFVKNLENVQGDERDVIFISTTYGPDTRGNQFQRFGPINGPSGHRRLNVLFTRAKRRVMVFSSLDPERIHTTANSPWGVRALKQYLMFARTGVLNQADEGTDQPTNDFERSVGAVLKAKGYDVVPQVGVAGFFIDLGVRHPVKTGSFLLGVECDGASYHSGRSARDRDRLRQEILENLGWKIHRIWSTDWFKNREHETKRLIQRIQELLDADPAYRKEQEKASRNEVLRQRLITLREKEIKEAFPETPPEKGLLKKSLLEEFMQKRPKTRDEWFRKISQQSRANVDPKQVGKYLDRVLEIIGEYD